MARQHSRIGVVLCGCCHQVLGFWPCYADKEQHGKLLWELDKLVTARQQQLQAPGGAAGAGGPEVGPPLAVVYNDAHLLTAHLTAHPEDRPAGWENVK
jgi:hypothetical protein